MISKCSDINIAGNKWKYWKITEDGEKLNIYLNSIKIIEVRNSNPSLSTGRIGLGSEYGTVHYDNI